jgi:hypothetical protein
MRDVQIPDFTEVVGDLFRIAIDLEVLNSLIYDKLIIHKLPLQGVILPKSYLYFVT